MFHAFVNLGHLWLFKTELKPDKWLRLIAILLSGSIKFLSKAAVIIHGWGPMQILKLLGLGPLEP